ncbi:MAG: hypothetical protein ACXADU_09120 [Promethearchaeota archaeon]|jgi:hypothetical protein
MIWGLFHFGNIGIKSSNLNVKREFAKVMTKSIVYVDFNNIVFIRRLLIDRALVFLYWGKMLDALLYRLSFYLHINPPRIYKQLFFA